MEFKELLGKIVTRIEGATEGSNRIELLTDENENYAMYHSQDCCESVLVNQIDGDVNDLLGSPLTMAEEIENPEDAPQPEYVADSYTWTFYRLATVKGYVTIRWLGESNGYYSESVDFVKL